ncbi:MAG TPA: IMP cyclohydrolase [Spirochaetota bacterium]|nr:IMP cyclohydrolase [Spirochaetota bacterium]HPJ41548.1 IMP cyclohydrolase [Spirochaetota bacterium]HPR36910.1 IMP cyclohydrolase [Spirochaetota bacterium]
MKDIKKAYQTVLDDNFPEEMTITFGDQKLVYRKRIWKINDEGTVVERGLRYGENPEQEAAMYELVNGNLLLAGCQFIKPGNSLVSGIDEEMMLQFGKHPGKINLTDIDNSLNILKYLMDRPAAVIVKHNNPCGVAYGSTMAEAFNRAFRADRIAAFGGCVALNRVCDKETAELISKQYLEVIAAPEYDGAAVDILKAKKNLRIVKIPGIDRLAQYRDAVFPDFKSLIDGGIIVQQSSTTKIKGISDLLPAVSEYKGERYEVERKPTDREIDDMLFGWYVEQGVTSNSVLYVKDGVTVGIGTGEQDRVGVAEIAIYKAYTKYADLLCSDKYGMSYKELELAVMKGERKMSDKAAIDEETKSAKGGLTGSTAISDAFFPFRDGVDAIIAQGISAILQPGGSIRDFESIMACNEANPKVTMMYTGQRAFKH